MTDSSNDNEQGSQAPLQRLVRHQGGGSDASDGTTNPVTPAVGYIIDECELMHLFYDPDHFRAEIRNGNWGRARWIRAYRDAKL